MKGRERFDFMKAGKVAAVVAGIGLLGLGLSKFDDYRPLGEKIGKNIEEMRSGEFEERILKNQSNEGRIVEKPVFEKVDYRTEDFSRDSDEILLARMLFGEARNCSDEEKGAIAYTAFNRANDGKKWNGESVRDSILKKWQYSCFNEGDPNREKLMDPESHDRNAWGECLRVADEVLRGEHSDLNKGQTHYHTRGINPSWASKIRKIYGIDGKHFFYRED
jgi:N-acetylmuramoyl-L-alanine amidase